MVFANTCTICRVKRVHTGEKQKEGARACAFACVSLASKPTLNNVSRSFQITLTSRKSQFDSFFSFLVFFFLLSIISRLFLLVQLSDAITRGSNLVISFSFLDKRLLLSNVHTDIRRIQAKYRCNKQELFEQETVIAIFIHTGGKKKVRSNKQGCC